MRALSSRVTTPEVLSLAVCRLALPKNTHQMQNAHTSQPGSIATRVGSSAIYPISAEQKATTATRRNTAATISSWNSRYTPMFRGVMKLGKGSTAWVS